MDTGHFEEDYSHLKMCIRHLKMDSSCIEIDYRCLKIYSRNWSWTLDWYLGVSSRYLEKDFSYLKTDTMHLTYRVTLCTCRWSLASWIRTLGTWRWRQAWR